MLACSSGWPKSGKKKSAFITHFSLLDSRKALGLFEASAMTQEDRECFLCRVVAPNASAFVMFGMGMTRTEGHKWRLPTPCVWFQWSRFVYGRFRAPGGLSVFYQLFLVSFWQLSGCHCHSQHIRNKGKSPISCAWTGLRVRGSSCLMQDANQKEKTLLKYYFSPFRASH